MFYALSDVHGCHSALQQALTKWNPETETLVVAGDLVDRGPDSFSVVQTLQQLKEQHGEKVVVLKGNHDQSFAQWAGNNHPEMFAYDYKSSHDETIRSFFRADNPEKGAKRFKKASRQQRGEHLRFKHKKEIGFLLCLHDHFETEHCLFVHAGVNLDREDWWMDTNAMLNTREAFYNSPKHAPKKTFFGHTPTALIREENGEARSNAVWTSPCGTKVGLDGGAAFGGQLNAVKVNEFGDVTETFAFFEDPTTDN